jgi:hypothetical protein
MRADKNSFRRRWRLKQDEHGFNTRVRLTTQAAQDHAATGLLLALGTKNQPHRHENAAEHKTRSLLTYTGQAGEHHRSLLVKPGDFHRTALTPVSSV